MNPHKSNLWSKKKTDYRSLKYLKVTESLIKTVNAKCFAGGNGNAKPYTSLKQSGQRLKSVSPTGKARGWDSSANTFRFWARSQNSLPRSVWSVESPEGGQRRRRHLSPAETSGGGAVNTNLGPSAEPIQKRQLLL